MVEREGGADLRDDHVSESAGSEDNQGVPPLSQRATWNYRFGVTTDVPVCRVEVSDPALASDLREYYWSMRELGDAATLAATAAHSLTRVANWAIARERGEELKKLRASIYRRLCEIQPPDKGIYHVRCGWTAVYDQYGLLEVR